MDYNILLEEVKNKCRKLEYELIRHLFSDNREVVLKELKKFQNRDKGFGKGLEADIRMNKSSVAATNLAISYLDDIDDYTMIKGIVSYYEKVFEKETNSFPIVPSYVVKKPHAWWWDPNKSTFPWGNPNPEVIGFLYKYKFATTLDIDDLVRITMNYIDNHLQEASMHTFYSMLKFYTYVIEDSMYEKKYKQLFIDRLHQLLEEMKDDEYKIEVHIVYNICPSIVSEELIKDAYAYVISKLESGVQPPPWSWGQYEKVFEKVKYEWSGVIIYDYLKFLNRIKKL